MGTEPRLADGSDRHGVRIVLAGTPADAPLADEFARVFHGEFVNQIGKTPLESLGSLTGRASLVVSNDTGAAHLAIAQGVPTVVVAPGNQIGRYFPYPDSFRSRSRAVFNTIPCFGCGPHCIFVSDKGQPRPCIADVGVESVLNAIEQVLGNRTCVAAES